MAHPTRFVEAHIVDVGRWRSRAATGRLEGVLLQTVDDRMLAIVLSPVDAAQLALILTRTPTPRPLTHSFFAHLLDTAHVRVERVEIDALAADIYHAKVHLLGLADGTGVDARPSDALALALLTESPVFVHEDVLRQAALDRAKWKPSWVQEHAASIARGASNFWQSRRSPDAPNSTAEHRTLRPTNTASEVLSRREEQVLRLVAAGCTNVEVGAALGLSPFTVTRHLSNVYSKLGVSRRAQAVTHLRA